MKVVHRYVYKSVDKFVACGYFLNNSQPEPGYSYESVRSWIVIHRLSTKSFWIFRNLFVLRLNGVGQIGNHVVNTSTFTHHLGNLFCRVHHSGVVSIAKELADLRKR